MGKVSKPLVKTKAEKVEGDYKYFRDKMLKVQGNRTDLFLNDGNNYYLKLREFYDLYNGKVSETILKALCKPIGTSNSYDSKVRHVDIVSSKLKAMIGGEIKRPFNYQILAVNEEATTEREEKEHQLIRDHVVNFIMLPIKEFVAKKYEKDVENLSEDEMAQLQQKMQKEIEDSTPDKVKQYIKRNHKDSYTVLGNQLISAFYNTLNLPTKFSKILKHGLISSMECMFIYEFDGEIEIKPMSPFRLTVPGSQDVEFIEDDTYVMAEHYFSKNEIVKKFRNFLDDEQIKIILEKEDVFSDDLMFEDNINFIDPNKRLVRHFVWRDLKNVGYLTYLDENGVQQEIQVDENFKFDKNKGHIEIYWAVEDLIHEIWTTTDDITLKAGFIENTEAKLPYYGTIYDNLESKPTSFIERMAEIQYLYDIIIVKIQHLIQQDKGKKVAADISKVPNKLGLAKHHDFFESSPFFWYDSSEEGYTDVNSFIKTLDLSAGSEIGRYIEMMEYLRQQVGRIVGITDQVEGLISPSEAVGNSKISINQSSNILEPYLYLHDVVKRNICLGIVDLAKRVYKGENAEKLSYVLDDFSIETLKIDANLLKSAKYSMYIPNMSKIKEIKENILTVSHAAMQNSAIKTSDFLKISKEEDLNRAEEILMLAEEKIQKEMQEMEAMKAEKQKEIIKMQEALEDKKHEQAKEIIILEAEKKKEIEWEKGLLMAASFNPDEDKDNDGINDFIQLIKLRNDNTIKEKKLELEEKDLKRKITKDKNDYNVKKSDKAKRS